MYICVTPPNGAQDGGLLQPPPCIHNPWTQQPHSGAAGTNHPAAPEDLQEEIE